MPQENNTETQSESTTNSGLEIDLNGHILASGGNFGSPEKRISSLNSAAKIGEVSPSSQRRLF